MKSYITSCIAGHIAFNEDLTVLDYELYPASKVTNRIIELKDGFLAIEEEALLNRISKKCDEVIIETQNHPKKYNHLKNYERFEFERTSIAGKHLRSNLDSILCEIGFINETDEFNARIHKILMDLTSMQLRESSEAEDKLLIQSINSLDELDESISKLVARLREWYSIHFPELDLMNNHELYTRLVAENGHRDSIFEKNLSAYNFDITESIGADIDDDDLLIIQNLANSIASLQKSRKDIEIYIETKMDKIAPNLKDIAGASLGAKLIAHVGSLNRMALYPSSTIQIMGAEKALFRHLTTGERPPKHGLIYQHPDIRSAKWWIRGKLARVLAAKISLAIRKDVYSGEYDPDIKKSYIKRVETIEKENPFPKRSSNSNKKQKIRKNSNISRKQMKKYSKKKKKSKKGKRRK